jgi:hypothetical protein
MKLYYKPSFSSKKKYYSLYSSLTLFVLSLYIIYRKEKSFLSLLLFITGFISSIHHCRSFEDEYNDICRILDMTFANILGIYILYKHPNQITFGGIFAIVCLFLHLHMQVKSIKLKSFFHSFLHYLLCLLVIYNYFLEPEPTQKNKSIISSQKHSRIIILFH